MRDMHCHILPGVDDGAHNLQESLEMLEAAKQVGITSIVCTPHCRDPYFDFDAMWEAFRLLEQHANGFPLTMGFEVNHAKLMDLGIEWAPKLTFQRSNEFLLELSMRATEYHFREYESTIYQLQSVGLDVIIAHPERYKAIQENVEIAYNLVEMGCKLQASADFIVGGRTGAEKKPAKRLFEENLYTLLFEGGWERDGAVDLRSMPRHQDFNSVCIFCFRQEFLVLLYHPVDGTDGFQEE